MFVKKESEGEKVVKTLVKTEEDLIMRVLDVIAGRETSAHVNLKGVRFMAGKTEVKLDGDITVAVTPVKKK